MRKAIILGVVFLFLISFVYGAFTINSYSPADLNVVINEGSTQEFNSVILTPSNENLIYNWELYKNNGQITAPSDIIFTRDEKEIFSINPDGTNLKQLTFRPSDPSWSNGGAIYDEYPSLAKDGKIVFARKDGDIAFHGAYQIWSMNLDGSGQTKLTDWFTASIPPNADYTGKLITSISLSDSNIYYNLNNKISKINYDGSNEENVFPTIIDPPGNSTAGCSQAKVSPDGTKIVCINKNNMVEMMNIDGSNEVILTTKDYTTDNIVPSLAPYTSPGWNFDGTRITFVTDKIRLWSINLDGSDLQLVMDKSCSNGINEDDCRTYHNYKYITASCWLSNHEIIYSASGELYKNDLSTGNIIQLTFRDPNYSMSTLWDQQVICRPIIKQNSLLTQQSSADKFTFSPINGDAGNYALKLNVSDDSTSSNLEWSIRVDPSVASAPTGASVASGGGGGSKSHPAVVVKTEEKTKPEEQVKEENQATEKNNQQNMITGQAVKETNNKGFLSSIQSLFSDVFNWIKSLFK